MKLKEGDLIFVSHKDPSLPTVIAKSTAMGRPLNYSHVGIVAAESGRLWVYHATRGLGCCRQRLSQFISGQKGRLDLYRPKIPIDVEEIVSRARSMVGQPYNASFSPREQGWYCSSYVWYAYQKTGLFHPVPMQFGPKGKKVLPYWRLYFRKLGKEIPVGQPGIAPNTLVLQGGLSYLGKLTCGRK